MIVKIRRHRKFINFKISLIGEMFFEEKKFLDCQKMSLRNVISHSFLYSRHIMAFEQRIGLFALRYHHGNQHYGEDGQTHGNHGGYPKIVELSAFVQGSIGMNREQRKNVGT